ncbi:MAG: hypothetical protein ACI9EF_002468, partial [Pseudohongiellaceae bacterium]
MLTVNLGTTHVEWRLSDLVGHPQTVALDDSGNAIHAVIHRLDSKAALERDHHGVRAHRASLHTHSRFSSNSEQNKDLYTSMAPFVHRAWWTDHNIGNQRTILGGNFEDAALVEQYWPALANRATVVFARSD